MKYSIGALLFFVCFLCCLHAAKKWQKCVYVWLNKDKKNSLDKKPAEIETHYIVLQHEKLSNEKVKETTIGEMKRYQMQMEINTN